VFRESLSANGVGDISYNAYPGCYSAYPGCHIRNISSDITVIGSDIDLNPIQRVSSARTFLKAIANSAEKDSLYQAMLKIELSHIIDAQSIM
jgi:hypothetical protein